MTEDEQKQKEMRERLRDKLRGNPELRQQMMVRCILPMLGAMAANKGVDIEFDDGVDEEIRDAVAQGYMAASMAEIATNPPWYLDLPLVGRVRRAARWLRRPRSTKDGSTPD